jgi:hypothetical protein
MDASSAIATNRRRPIIGVRSAAEAGETNAALQRGGVFLASAAANGLLNGVAGFDGAGA